MEILCLIECPPCPHKWLHSPLVIPQASSSIALPDLKAEEKYEQAIFWYKLALTKQRNDASGAFISPDCYGYLPYIQLCERSKPAGLLHLIFQNAIIDGIPRFLGP